MVRFAIHPTISRLLLGITAVRHMLPHFLHIVFPNFIGLTRCWTNLGPKGPVQFSVGSRTGGSIAADSINQQTFASICGDLGNPDLYECARGYKGTRH
jgi:hypothetical protein